VVDGPDMRWPQQNNQHNNGHVSSTETTPLFISNPVNHNQTLKVFFCCCFDHIFPTVIFNYPLFLA
jgi:hypothetical protein